MQLKLKIIFHRIKLLTYYIIDKNVNLLKSNKECLTEPIVLILFDLI